jgi:putative ABC transport system permease protein
MRGLDILRFALQACRAASIRAGLILVAVAIGVAAVLLLTALGESARRYVAGQFAALGTHLLIVLPGRAETIGSHPPLLGETPRDLTLDDALALLRSRHILRVAPVILGSAPVSWQGREREITIVGSTADLQAVRHLTLSSGRFLPPLNPRRGSPVCVLGDTIRQELFGSRPVLGQWLRIGDRRCRVIGVLAPAGQSLGWDLKDIVLIPVASAQSLFNQFSLFRILVEARTREGMDLAIQDIRRIVPHRHAGEDDITVITQDAVLATFDRILRALTLTVAGIAAISLLVAGILIMNVMLVAVSQRTEEIGLLKAVGAPAWQINLLFLSEAALLSLVGAGLGVLVGLAGVWAGASLYPTFPLTTPLWAVGAAVEVSLAVGMLFGVLPARRAARLDPVQALSRR